MQLPWDEPAPRRVISVSDLNRLAKELIESRLPLMWVEGEISNFTRAASGHCYFSLKDESAQVRCVMFRHKGQLHDWKPANGMRVEVRACPSFYEARGEFQLNVEVMRRAGLGSLYEAFERLKAKLQAEGLFDPALKLPLPSFPRAIGIVTSLHAAALRDVLTTLRRRMAAVPIIIYPTAVQGDGAAQQIATTIRNADGRGECDVLVLCRGGGTIEDLWAFNEEIVARAIHACRLPVISGIGHETDFTIADFVADARAPTPTAAAQMASPDREHLCRAIGHLYHRLARMVERDLERRMQHVDGLARRLTHPGERIANQVRELHQLRGRLGRAWQHASDEATWHLRELAQDLKAARPDFAALRTEQQTLGRRLVASLAQRMAALRSEVKSLAAQLAQLNPQAVLERGYSITYDEHGRVVKDSNSLTVGEEVNTRFARGSAHARVSRKE